MRIGVMGALPEEVDAVIAALDAPRTKASRSRRTMTSGRHGSHELTCCHARIGKVAAAITATELVLDARVEMLLFTGLAGALDPALRVGDIVIGEGFYQHDLDASPLFPPLEIPLTGVSRLAATPLVTDALQHAAERNGSPESRVVRGDIASGDQFIGSAEARTRLRQLVPTARCAEMEGAAVAQVCTDYAIPFGVIRIVSDAADAEAADSFTDALATGIADRSSRIVLGAIRSLSDPR